MLCEFLEDFLYYSSTRHKLSKHKDSKDPAQRSSLKDLILGTAREPVCPIL